MYISRMRANVVKEDVERTIGKVLEEKGHKRIPLNEHNIYYVKRYSDRLGFYVRCRDDERVGGGGGITIQFFFTTIQLPNDKQIVSYPGIEIHVLTKYSDITDELLIAAGNKVIAIENDIGSMSGMILAEMESPYLFPERSQIVKEVLTIYDIVSKDWKNKFEVLRDKVNKTVEKGDTETVFSLCSEFIDDLPTDYLQGKMFTMDLNAMKSIFSDHLIAQCMFGV